MITEIKLETTGIKVVMAYFKVLPQHLIGKFEENDERPRSGYLSSSGIWTGYLLMQVTMSLPNLAS